MVDECGDKAFKRHKHEYACLIPNNSNNSPRLSLSEHGAAEADRNLTSWENIVKDRKKMSTKLAKATGRNAADITMHSGINLREVKERKMILELAQVEVKAEIRGEPWEQPLRLHQTCPCQPVYELQQTKIEMGKVHDIEYVGVPEYIQKEEHGIVGKATIKHGSFEKSAYKAGREAELKEKIEQAEPHRPILKTLIIKGNKPVKVEKKPRLPEVIIMKPYLPCTPELTDVQALRINNTVLIKDHPLHDLAYLRSIQREHWHRDITLWTYYFNTPIGNMSRNKLILTNLGTVTVRYCWQSMKENTKLGEKSVYDPVFFFNKNEDLLSPGQTREIIFIFVSSSPGIYKEMWQFNVCNVDFLKPGNEFTIILNADATELNLNHIKREVANLKTYIASEERNYTVRLIVNELVDKSVEVPPECYAYEKMFLDDALFVMKNPDCHYHQTVIENLKHLYEAVVSHKDTPWDLSVVTLEKEIMKQPFDERIQSYNKLKEAYRVLVTPFEEKVFLPEQKITAMKQMLNQFIDKFDSERNNLKMSYCRHRKLARRLSGEPDIFNEIIFRQLFYITMKEHFCVAIENGVGLLNSLDLYRSLEFV